jgi:osmotically-inducible protein OsmY
MSGWHVNHRERKRQQKNKPIYDLHHQIQEALAEINDLRGARIDILDINGVVTLTGIVPTVDARERAEAIVRGMDSVTSVINELNVV